MKLSEMDVVHVAKLAGLALTEEEVRRMVGQISGILDYVEGLPAAPAEEEKPEDLATRLAPDLVSPSLPLERALENAPHRSGSFFSVPRILEEGR